MSRNSMLSICQGKHQPIEVARGGDPLGPEHVVYWCQRCGSIRQVEESDNRTLSEKVSVPDILQETLIEIPVEGKPLKGHEVPLAINQEMSRATDWWRSFEYSNPEWLRPWRLSCESWTDVYEALLSGYDLYLVIRHQGDSTHVD